MKWRPRKPDASVNRPKEHPLRDFGTLVVGTAVLVLLVSGAFALFVDVVVYFVDPATERRALRPLAPTIRAAFGHKVDEDASASLTGFAEKHVLTDDPAIHGLDFFVVCNDVPNAFAIPGGEIVVTSALLQEVKTEGELLFILGHEVGHFLHRDHLRGLGRKALGSLFWAVAFRSSQIDPELFTTAFHGALSAGYDRKQELDADRVGVRALHLNHQPIGAAASTLEALARAGKEEWSDRLDFSRSHPVSTIRVSEIRAIADRESWAWDGESEAIASVLQSACSSTSP